MKQGCLDHGLCLVSCGALAKIAFSSEPQHERQTASYELGNHLINQYSSQTLKSYQAHMVNAIGCAWYLLLGKTS